MNVVSEVKTVALEDLDSADLDGFNIIDAVPEDGPVAEGSNVYRSEPLWADQTGLHMTRQDTASTEGENLSILHIAVPDISDEEAIRNLKQKVSDRLDQA